MMAARKNIIHNINEHQLSVIFPLLQEKITMNSHSLLTNRILDHKV